MITTKNGTATAVVAGVWAAAASAAAVLMYDLNSPLSWAGRGAHFTTPLVSALVAGGSLALISAFLWWRRRVQRAQELEPVYARVHESPAAWTSGRPRSHGQDEDRS
jgi:hypothetical protein